MTDPNPTDRPPVSLPPHVMPRGWPWAQCGLLSLNMALFLMGLCEIVVVAGIVFPDTVTSIGELLFLGGILTYGFSRKPRPLRPAADDPVPLSLGLHRLNLGLFGGAVTLITCGMVLPSLIIAGRESPQSAGPKEPDDAGWKSVFASRSGVRLDVPAHWQEETNLSLEAMELSFQDTQSDLLVVVLSVAREDVTYVTLDSWAREGLLNIEASQILERTALEGSTFQILMDLTNNNTRLVFLMKFLETPQRYICVRTIATRSGFRTHEGTLREIIRSVRPE